MVQRILGEWLGKQLLPMVNRQLRRKRARVSRNEQKRYNAVTSNVLLKFFFQRFLSALIQHRKHKLDTQQLLRVHAALIGKHRAEAIRASLDFGEHTLAEIIGSFSAHIQNFVVAGTVSTVDETIFPHFGKVAFDRGQLRHIPGKPHDYGLLAYVLSQRLFFTNLPICLSVQPVFLRHALKPIDAALELLRSIQCKDIGSSPTEHLVADSLWSQPVHIDLFNKREIGFTVAIKPDNKGLPEGLIELGASDLPLHASRTYTDGTLVVQVHAGASSETAVISNVWQRRNQQLTSNAVKGSWKSAQSLYRLYTVDDLVRLFDLEPRWLNERKSKIVHHVTGWDVLRPPDEQGSQAPLTFEQASSLSREALLEVHHQALHLPRPDTKKSMAKLLIDLIPMDARESHSSGTKRKAEHQQERIQQLTALREEVRKNLQKNQLLDLFIYFIARCEDNMNSTAACMMSGLTTGILSIG